MWKLGDYFLERLRGSQSYVRNAPEHTLSPTCHAILYPYDALGLQLHFGTYGAGTKPSPAEIEELQWGAQIQRYSGQYPAPDFGGSGYQNSWAYGGEKCTLDLVTSAQLSPRWLLLSRIPDPNNNGTSQQVPMEPECGGDEPGPFYSGPDRFIELEWSLPVWLLLRLCALGMEWASLFGLAVQQGWMKSYGARLADIKEKRLGAFRPSLVNPMSHGCCCIKFARCKSYQMIARKNKAGKKIQEADVGRPDVGS
jgi:hypothetical protein